MALTFLGTGFGPFSELVLRKQSKSHRSEASLIKTLKIRIKALEENKQLKGKCFSGIVSQD